MVDANKGAASAALPSAGEAEPVAWRYSIGGSEWDVTVEADIAERRRKIGQDVEPLYLHPSPSASEAQVRVTLEKAKDALRPLADAVFNDNGDMTVNLTIPSSEECIQAYFATKRILSALSTPEQGETPPSPETHLEGDQHPDDLAVDRFAAAMKAKLAKKRDEGRGGWEDKEQCSNAFLSRLLVEHVQKGDPVDVGNLAMMIHQRGEGIGVAAGNTSAIAQLNAIVDAWEALPGGRQVNNSDVERWLARHMGPGIDAIRGFLRRPRPDGILPPPPQPRAAPPSPSPSTPSPRKETER